MFLFASQRRFRLRLIQLWGQTGSSR
uniref:Uncharacterized protein n=1 Tax=Anguilla anguilla TaxID=7936 RepID=A0A0E9QGS7_ANGAN